jgi:cell division transport system ATP-binding protein
MGEEDILIYYRNVTLYRGENIILQNVTFKQRKGEFLYVIGKVGSGKSSLLKTLYCDMPIYKGEAFIFDYNLRKIRNKQIPLYLRNLVIVFLFFKLLPDLSLTGIL